RVHRYEQHTDPATGETVHRAVDWEPYEISVVPIPVDPAAAIRGEDAQGSPTPANEPALTQDTIMPDPMPAAATAAQSPPAALSQETAVTTPSPAPAAPPPAPSAADPVAEALRGERERIAALGPVLAASRGLVPPAIGDALHQRAMAEGWTAEVLRGALWDAMVQGVKPPAIPAAPTTTVPAQGDPTVLREAMAEALAVRAMPGYQAQDAGRHSEFLGWRPSEMVAELMRARGERNVPRDTAKLAERAFHTTSDFPLLLSAAANKMLLAAYQPAQPTYRLLNLANGAGPTLTTGSTTVFATAAARANMAATGTALDLPNLALGRAAIMKQKTLDGLPISIGSSMRLVVGPNQEIAARQLTVNVAATQTSNANVFAGFVQPLVEPQIPANRWYLFSDPSAAPVYVYGYLNGAEGPQVTTGPVSGVDGVEVSVIFDFGVGAIDWRGAWFNAGT
ncbi:MAG: terminase, partial [Caulobacteraceae bacterium]|nr:terminase [Caulobacteraceae bacterium]